MARRRGPSRGRGRREAEPVAEPLSFAEPERPMRASRSRGGGGGAGGAFLGLVVPLVLSFTAAVVILVGGFLVAGAAKTKAEAAFDAAGVSAALALSAGEPTWWEPAAGQQLTEYQVWQKIKAEYIKKQSNTGDKRDKIVAEKDMKELEEKLEIKPDATTGDRQAALDSANRNRLSRIVNAGGGRLLFAGILKADHQRIFLTGGEWDTNYGEAPYHEVGQVRVTPVFFRGRPARMYDAPIYDFLNLHATGQAGGYARVVIDATQLEAISSGVTVTIVVSALIGLLLVGGIGFAMCMGASKGLNRVARDLSAVAQGDLDVRIRTTGGGEVSAVARAAERAMKTFRAVQEQSIAAASAAPVAIAPAQVGVDTSTLLPSEPPRIEGYEFEAVHKPCAEGANDFYDYVQVDPDHVGVVIADMPHPGAKGAFIASTFRALIRAFGTGETSPAAVLGKVNRVLAAELKRGDHITAMYTVLDTKNGILSVASAGHLPLIFWKLSKKGSALLNPEGIAIGLDKGPVFEKTVVDKRIKMEKGDRVVLYTDGPVAAQNAEQEEYGEQRFYYLVNREAPKNSAAFVNFVANEVDLFHEGAIQLDDITIVTVRKLS